MGVGAKELGEWHEVRPLAYHLRRRLSPAEQLRVGDAVDIRGSVEAAMRVEAVKLSLPFWCEELDDSRRVG